MIPTVSIASSSTPRRLSLGVVTTAVALAASCFGGAAIAFASPNNEWDIGAYDECMSKTIRDADYCCVASGGIAGLVPGSCTAPAAVVQDPPAQGPGFGPRPGPKRTPVPVAPPSDAIVPPPGAVVTG